MELFSEIYSCYYQVIKHILEKSCQNGIDKNEMKIISDKYAFYESSFYIIPKLINNEWDLVEKEGNLYKSKIKNIKNLPLTNLQKAWIKTILSDKKMNLFLEKQQIDELKSILSDVEVLFKIDDFYYFDKYDNGDCYDNIKYINNFKYIFNALKQKKVINITYISLKEKVINCDFLPIKIEYSPKEDIFRVYCVKIFFNTSKGYSIINISRILKITHSSQKFDNEIDLKQYFNKIRKKEPVVIKIFNERNALERCMLHFANFEKHTEYIKDTDTYLCSIYYDKNDELELLIRILSFGPVIKVISPDSFISLIKERIISQKKLFDELC